MYNIRQSTVRRMGTHTWRRYIAGIHVGQERRPGRSEVLRSSGEDTHDEVQCRAREALQSAHGRS